MQAHIVSMMCTTYTAIYIYKNSCPHIVIDGNKCTRYITYGVVYQILQPTISPLRRYEKGISKEGCAREVAELGTSNELDEVTRNQINI